MYFLAKYMKTYKNERAGPPYIYIIYIISPIIPDPPPRAAAMLKRCSPVHCKNDGGGHFDQSTGAFGSLDDVIERKCCINRQGACHLWCCHRTRQVDGPRAPKHTGPGPPGGPRGLLVLCFCFVVFLLVGSFL